MQEIMAKFNSGYLRTVDVQKTFFETVVKMDGTGNIISEEPVGVLPGEFTNSSNSEITAPETIRDVNQGGGNTNTLDSSDTNGTVSKMENNMKI
jgi:hypothetical protein